MRHRREAADQRRVNDISDENLHSSALSAVMIRMRPPVVGGASRMGLIQMAKG